VRGRSELRLRSRAQAGNRAVLGREALGIERKALKVGKEMFVNPFGAYCVIVLSTVLGGGSLLLFAAFLIAGPFTIIRLDASEGQVLIWNGSLSMLFFIQHSGMIRANFRTWLSSAIPRYYHPATYSIVSGIVLTIVVLLWQTSQTVLFRIQDPLQVLPRAIALLAIAGFIWGVQALRTFDAFGRIPIVVHLHGKQLRPPDFVLRGPYLWVRHPLYFFMLVLIWSTPNVTSDRLLFNVLWTFWIVLGSYLEEKDIVAEFGERYRDYQKTVPMLLPWRGPIGRGLLSP
jgi:protein-S-isoprenylcysteine O-methyltransferase Ste14